MKYPITDSAFLILLVLNYVTSIGYNVGVMTRHLEFLPTAIVAIGMVSGYLPLAYTLFLIVHWIFTKRKLQKG